MGKDIIYQGKRYQRFEDLPPEARLAYEQLYALAVDEDQNGIPDILEGKRQGIRSVHRLSMRSLLEDPRLTNLENMPIWLKKLVGKLAQHTLRDMPTPWSSDIPSEDHATRFATDDVWEPSKPPQPMSPAPLPYEEVSTSHKGLLFILVALLFLLFGAILTLLFLT